MKIKHEWPTLGYTDPAQWATKPLRRDLSGVLSATVRIGLSGRFTLVRRKASDESVIETREFDNLITDIGLDRWGSGGPINRCQVGSGNSAPQFSDTGLQALVATTTNSRTVSAPFNAFSYDATNRSQTYTGCYRFNVGVATGTLAEIAMGWSEAPAGIWCRALILDEGGNPATITILSDEILDVYYSVKLQYPATDASGSLTLNGISYEWIGRPARLGTSYSFDQLFGYGLVCRNADSLAKTTNSAAYSMWYAYSGTIGGVSGYPSGTNSSFWTYHQHAAYVPGSYTRVITGSTTTDEASAFSIKSVAVTFRPQYPISQFEWQFEFTPAIPKGTMVLSLTATITWARG